jgi:hypothetical protein
MALSSTKDVETKRWRELLILTKNEFRQAIERRRGKLCGIAHSTNLSPQF